jgi:hypothetical protein
MWPAARATERQHDDGKHRQNVRMTSRSLGPGRTEYTERAKPPAGPELVGLPGQPESRPNGRSHPGDVLTVVQLRAHADELGFSPQDQVRWLAPGQLTRTAVQVLLVTAFSSFNDKRELQRTFPNDPLALPADQDGGCWFDFMADTGDGFDSTFTVASLLAAPQLTVTAPDGEQHQLPRGRLLVLGGDEVYPTASSEGYEDRLKGPLRTALHTDDVAGAPPPLLLALPGNHDWYDGLTAFLRVFGQRRRIGGWQTVQGRSYFVLQLPNGWWLAGLDSQLGSEIDDPQLDFFRTELSQKLQPGDGVILCCATPAWIRTPYDARAFDSFDFFERTIVDTVTDPQTGQTRRTGAQIRLWITGDSHHYARYAEQPPDLPTVPTNQPNQSSPPSQPGQYRQLITSGLGGAYLSATHHLPQDVTLPPAGSAERHHGPPVSYRLAARWPSEPESKGMVAGILSLSRRGLPFRNPGFWRLAAAVHTALFLLLILLLGTVRQQGPIDAVRSVAVMDVVRLGAQLALWWLVSVAASTVVNTYRARRLRLPSLAVGVIGAQLAVGVLALIATVWVVRAVTLPGWFPGGRSLPNFVLLVVMVAVVAPVAGLIGSYGVALTLALSRSRPVADWQFSAQSIDDRKGFVRLRIEPDGRLVVYPVVVDQVPRRWRITADSPARPPRRVTAADGLPPAYLVEDPVVIQRTPQAS